MESLLISPVGDEDSPHRKLSQRCTGLSAAALGVILGVDLILLGIEAVVFAIDCYCRLK